MAHPGAAEAEPVFLKGLKAPDPSVRFVAARGTEAPPGTQDSGELDTLLKDTIDEVRWNAALALGRKGVPAGRSILMQLIDRRCLDRHTSMDPDEKFSAIPNAMQALKYLQVMDLDDGLRETAEKDPDPRAREAARIWLAEPGS